MKSISKKTSSTVALHAKRSSIRKANMAEEMVELEDIQSSTENQQATSYNRKSSMINHLHNYSPSEIKKSGKNLIAILVSTNKFPFGNKLKCIYDFFLITFYLANFTYSTVMFAIKRNHIAYNVVSIVISAIGLLMKAVILLVNCCIKHRRLHQQGENLATTPDENTHLRPGTRTHATEDLSKNGHTTVVHDSIQNNHDTRDHMKKERNIIVDCAIGLLGEILIYSSMICALYGFIDERGWKFDRAFAELDFTLLVYNIATDMIYTKLIYIGTLMKTAILLQNQDQNSDQRNNTNNENQTNHHESFRNESEYCSEEPETGEYRTTPFTRYMIFCGFFLPVASTIQNILFMGWFTPLCESIVDRNSPWSVIFVNEPLSNLFAPFLILSFTGFIIGAFLVDYSTEEYELQTHGNLSSNHLLDSFYIKQLSSCLNSSDLGISAVLFASDYLQLSVLQRYSVLRMS